jgi:hypothetical protein
MRKFFQTFYERLPPHDVMEWHKWTVFWPVRTVDGRLAWSLTWRRWNGKTWEYKIRELTEDEYWESKLW